MSQTTPDQAGTTSGPTAILDPETESEGQTQEKVFTLNDVVVTIPVQVHWPALYPGYKPWGFAFNVALSDDMQKKREKLISTPQTRTDDQVRNEVIDEVCDLLQVPPTGFGDWPNELMSPGAALRAYYNGIRNPVAKETVYQIILAASNGYWAKATPREFRP